MGTTCEACCSDDRTVSLRYTEVVHQGDHTVDIVNANTERRNKPSVPNGAANDLDEGNVSDDSYDDMYHDFEENPWLQSDLSRGVSSAESAEKKISQFKSAINSGNDALVVMLMTENMEMQSHFLELQFDNEDSALHVAVRNHYFQLIVLLLNEGLSPNLRNADGDTPLHTAVRSRVLRVVALLTKNGADPDTTNDDSETPITIAQKIKDDDIVELLAPDTVQILDTLKRQDDNNSETISENEQQQIKTQTTVQLDVDSSPKKPQTVLKRVNTQNALNAIARISIKKKGLPQLEAWLEKKQVVMPYKWQRRWVIVRDSHMLWSDTKRDIENAKSMKERSKWKNSLNLVTIQSATAVTASKTQRKFIVTVIGTDNKKREYLWKCPSMEARGYWVSGLHAHIDSLNQMLAFLKE